MAPRRNLATRARTSADPAATSQPPQPAGGHGARAPTGHRTPGVGAASGPPNDLRPAPCVRSVPPQGLRSAPAWGPARRSRPGPERTGRRTRTRPGNRPAHVRAIPGSARPVTGSRATECDGFGSAAAAHGGNSRCPLAQSRRPIPGATREDRRIRFGNSAKVIPNLARTWPGTGPELHQLPLHVRHLSGQNHSADLGAPRMRGRGGIPPVILCGLDGKWTKKTAGTECSR